MATIPFFAPAFSGISDNEDAGGHSEAHREQNHSKKGSIYFRIMGQSTLTERHDEPHRQSPTLKTLCLTMIKTLLKNISRFLDGPFFR
jgi:hypothetical protein